MAKRRRRLPGEGSIYRRTSDGRWVAKISRGPRDARRVWVRYAPLRDNTRDAAKALLVDLEAEAAIPSSSTELGAYLARWVVEVRNIRPATRHGYEVVVDHHLAPTIGHIPLRDLQPRHVESMLAALAPTMSPKTLRNIHTVLRRALGQAVRAGLVNRNVASREFVDAPRVPTVEPRSLTLDEVRRFREACRGDRQEALYVLALGTGLRLGELLGLSWGDIDGDLVSVRNELVRRDGAYQREAPKTERSRRIVPLAPALVALLAQHRNRLAAEGYVPISTGPVFVNTTGGPLSGSWATHHLYGLLAAAGIERTGFKNLRTTFSSLLFAAGVPDRTIADLLGHTRTATTQKHYIATLGTTQAAAVGVIESMVG